jgi:hypothetical protein
MADWLLHDLLQTAGARAAVFTRVLSPACSANRLCVDENCGVGAGENAKEYCARCAVGLAYPQRFSLNFFSYIIFLRYIINISLSIFSSLAAVPPKYFSYTQLKL